MPIKFNKLLEQSRQLNSHIYNTSLPILERDLDQIENQSRKLAAKALRAGDGIIDTGACCLLANGGFPVEQVSQIMENLNTLTLATTFEPLQPIPDTDIESFLNLELENIVLKTIEQGKNQITKDFNDSFEKSIHKDWKNTKQKLCDHLEHSTVISSNSSLNSIDDLHNTANTLMFTQVPFTELANDSSKQIQVKEYANVVKKINQIRNELKSAKVFNLFYECSLKIARINSSIQSVSDSWRLLTYIFKESTIGNKIDESLIKEKQFTNIRATSKDVPDTNMNEFNSLIINGSKKYFEDTFWEWIQKEVKDNTGKIFNNDSKQSVIDTISLFISFRLKKYGEWDQSLELINSFPIWSCIFYLIRSGHFAEAIYYINDIDDKLFSHKNDLMFIKYIKIWIDNKFTLNKKYRDEIKNDWNERIRSSIDQNTIKGDPFKHCLYKIIGRCDINFKNIPDQIVIPSVEDYLWVHLTLVQNGNNQRISTTTSAISTTFPSIIFDNDTYTYDQMVTNLLKYEPNYFNQENIWNMVLIICGKFENVVDFLFSRDQYHVEAVHFAIAFAYYGLLRITNSVYSIEYLVNETRAKKTKSVIATSSSFDSSYTAPTIKSASFNLGSKLNSYSLAKSSKNNPFISSLNVITNKNKSNAYGFEKEGTTDNDITSIISKFNFARLIHQYSNNLSTQYPDVALHYLYFICLYGIELDQDGKEDDNSEMNDFIPKAQENSSEEEKTIAKKYTQLTYKYIQELVLLQKSESIPHFFGKVNSDGGIQSLSEIEQYKNLIHIHDHSHFIKYLIKPTARSCENEGRLADAVYLYNLSESYETVVDILNKQLSDALASHQYTLTQDHPVILAQNIMQNYVKQPSNFGRLESKQKTCAILIKLTRFMDAYQRNSLAEALSIMKELDLIPLEGDMTKVMMKAEEFQNLDKNIVRLFPELLTTTMRCIYGLWRMIKNQKEVFMSENSSKEQLTQMNTFKKMARMIIVFTGTIQSQIIVYS
ncbi:NIC-domain-containing protein [Neocallimastix californiae]|uniref:Nuclear pore protein n=1 Tax=Neocallimastix californiae TaxID=1754190 RepID=A0A1Y2FB11_9FUNG|nr:NIC-domain-containing protein [Neocallimastix californiae]|eukprot:ORY81099.1 NIC-domain-containing protein [Neocallimastix californiae]